MLKWLIAGVALVACSSASASDFEDWRSIGGWQIKRNVELQACQLSAVYKGDGETILLLRYTPSTDTAIFSVGNAGWISLKEGDDPQVTIDFGAAGKWSDVSTTSFIGADYHWLMMKLEGLNFLKDFASSGYVHIRKGDVVVDKLDLQGSRAAVLALIECANGINKGIARDPFK